MMIQACDIDLSGYAKCVGRLKQGDMAGINIAHSRS